MSQESDIKEWYYHWGKGKIVSFVVKAKEKYSTVLRTLKTALQMHHLREQDIERMFVEIEIESVEPFRDRGNYRMRKQRLVKLRSGILGRRTVQK